MWPDLDGFIHTFRSLWKVHPEEHRILLKAVIPFFLLNLVILWPCHVKGWLMKGFRQAI